MNGSVRDKRSIAVRSLDSPLHLQHRSVDRGSRVTACGRGHGQHPTLCCRSGVSELTMALFCEEPKGDSRARDSFLPVRRVRIGAPCGLPKSWLGTRRSTRQDLVLKRVRGRSREQGVLWARARSLARPHGVPVMACLPQVARVPHPSIERTSYGSVRLLTAAAHVER